MILTGNEIKKRVGNSEIDIKPFTNSNVSTNSYDITLDNYLIKYTEKVIDPRKESNYEIIEIPDEGYILKKGEFFLGSSKEIIGSDYFVPLIHAKSGVARLGLFVHITADLIDIGYKGNITFQLYSVNDLKIYKDMKVGQVSFWKCFGDIELYNGKYKDGKGAQVSKTFKDFK